MEYQRFKGRDVILVYAALAVVGLTSIGFVRTSAQSLGGSEAQKQMTQISRQILSDGFSTLAAAEGGISGRSVASVLAGSPNSLGDEGRIGQDPWGTAYSYKVYQNDSGRRSVVIWSFGPNRQKDSKETDLLLGQSGWPLRVLPREDDLGHLEIGL